MTKKAADKEALIREAAMKIFAQEGYERASTNQIVKEAGIGKGMLFYYFQNKYELFATLAEESMTFVAEDFLQQIDVTEPDFIRRLQETTALKMKVMEQSPYVFHFLTTLFSSDLEKLPPHLQEKYQKIYTEGHGRLYQDVDLSFFRTDIDRDKAFHLIQWALEGYEADLKNRLNQMPPEDIDVDATWREFAAYVEVLRTSFYQKKGVE
ncbi:TetR family transcriptional regulator [Salsuginibacillus halophilus]|uniref:TetR family transcriptional regulator n=1 Tax=Salsuginibacillus halophilus TaxID=517424 RepID=A0A2P8HAQ7_9BACI|nr:TetR/AcrR family transcriptional regulator [Salsuginibacillus halophilus]PSL43297.1 TetR family transcriptional regulator [Salsuginibacillus halophilus]